ncbi:phage Gp37/Gp68 family protein [Acidovorax sp. SUPP2825]|uniref:phage Gp37/Gp68 family protein n=1 Tax=Acidovorax sp. SUPP2825 TaxID=2920879 RepID=UPI0023DE1F2C|nr:phage Gp37/Gp68 family protein [Acidovorax sp. SUPP2825]GKS96914.1 phage Gp37/Gp68 family protein [Acidovorax sp. SUPP2825]
MSSNTSIEWCDHTFNPWTGCTKVSPGCDHCYAEGWAKRSGQVQWGPQAARRRTSSANWNLPRRWNAQAEAFRAQHGRRQRVFCASLADVFDNAVEREWRDDLATLILNTPGLDWLLLTKRIGNAGAMLGEMFLNGPPDNLWLGATICNPDEADRDITKLLRVPARVRFLSMEPLLAHIDLRLKCPNWSDDIVMDPETGAYECCRACDYTGIGNDIDWVIVGGESGPGARPMHPDWARSLRNQCEAAGVPFLFKQWGDWRAPQPGEEFDTSLGMAQRVPAFIVAHDGSVHCFHNDQASAGSTPMLRVGKKSAGRELDGRTHDEFPS